MKHFLQGKNSAGLPSLRPPSATAVLTPAPAKKISAPPQHQIDVVKEGDKVTRIVVTCACGEVVEIDCLYAAGR